MQPTSNLKWYIIIAILVMIMAPSLTLNVLNSTRGNLFPKSNSIEQPANIDQKIFDSQNATFTGKITKVDGNKIWIENKNGVKGQIELSPNVLITKPTLGMVASASADIKQIELEKEVTMNFQKINGEYQAISINYLTPINSQIQASPLPPPIQPTGSKIPQPQQTPTPFASITPPKPEKSPPETTRPSSTP